MSNAKSIYTCLQCDDRYCSECSNSSKEMTFCSMECQEKNLQESLSKNIDKVFDEKLKSLAPAPEEK